MQSTIWLDGKIVSREEASIPFLTHALHYGSAVFEGIRFYETPDGPAIFRLHEHVQRLFNSAKAISMKIPYNEDQIVHAIIETVKSSNLTEGYIRPLVFYAHDKMGLNPTGVPVRVGIAVWPWPAYLGTKPIRVKISPYIRIHPKSLNNHAKVSGHYVNSIMATLESQKSGFDEALLLDYEGDLAEGPGANIFLVHGDILFTPPRENILPGITRDTIIQLALKDGYHVREIAIHPSKIAEAEEAFFVGTAVEVLPIESIDNKPLGKSPGEVTLYFQTLYYNIVHGKVPEYDHWLTYVNPRY